LHPTNKVAHRFLSIPLIHDPTHIPPPSIYSLPSVDDNTGPLEATIKNLLKEISSVNKETGELSREWIKTQTELVALVSQSKTEYDLVDEVTGSIMASPFPSVH
jgi:hypothetical protein